MLIDTHTHLYVSKFDEDRDEVIQRCIDNDVKKMLLPAIDSETTEALLNLSDAYPNVFYPMMGVHPSSINKESINFELENAKKHLFGSRKFIAVGEIGIDLYWDKTTLPEQIEAFKIQMEWAKELDLPIVIHAREAFDEIFEVLDEVHHSKLRGVFHCFTGNEQHAQKIISYGGFKLGIGGVVTFKNSTLSEVLKTVDLKHILLETDAPYLAPTPHRGKRNSGEYLPLIGDKLADIYNCTLPEIAEITTQNAKELFGLEI